MGENERDSESGEANWNVGVWASQGIRDVLFICLYTFRECVVFNHCFHARVMFNLSSHTPEG